METNVLYYGDNLKVLRHTDDHGDHDYFPSESVDLIYLDPPFNSQQSYNILFREQDTSWSPAQIRAFEDTWGWNQDSEAAYEDIVQKGPMKLAKLISAMREGIGGNAVMAYLVMMTVRLVEMHRVLKPTGSLYLHCDPTMSHYIKLVLDQIFGPTNFRNEIVWKRTSAHGDVKQGSQQSGRVHDTILYYAKSPKAVWNAQYTEYDQEYVDTFYRHVEPGTGRRYRLDNLTASRPGGDTEYEWKGVRPYKGRYWAYSKANMEKFEREGRLVYSKGGFPQYKRYLDEMPGMPVQDLWADIPPALGKERQGYQTQKPLKLLERIISYGSDEGDIVLDPFCGCGTAVVAAHKLGRRWIGIDITYLAIGVMKRRLQEHFPDIQVREIGVPEDLPSAKALFKQDAYQFQWWALPLIGARPLGEKKKGADQGIDGVIPFTEGQGGGLKRAVVSVKGGKVGVRVVRELRGVIEATGDPIGVLLTLEPPTTPMNEEAAAAGFYEATFWEQKCPRLQIITVEEALSGKKPLIPIGAVAPPGAAPIKKKGKQARLL